METEVRPVFIQDGKLTVGKATPIYTPRKRREDPRIADLEKRIAALEAERHKNPE